MIAALTTTDLGPLGNPIFADFTHASYWNCSFPHDSASTACFRALRRGDLRRRALLALLLYRDG